MDSFRELGRTLLIAGGCLVLAGGFLFFGGRLPIRLGRLPGDIIRKGENSSFYFPLTTCLLLSVVLTLIFWLIGRFRR